MLRIDTLKSACRQRLSVTVGALIRTYAMMTVPKLLLREIAASFRAAKRNRDLSGFDAINQA
jgi:hypothetical protein